MIAPIFADLAKKFMSSAIFFKVDVDELQVNTNNTFFLANLATGTYIDIFDILMLFNRVLLKSLVWRQCRPLCS